MYIFTAAREVLFNPKAFFQSKRDDNSLAGTFFYGFILVVLSGVIRYVYVYLTQGIDELANDKNFKVIIELTDLSPENFILLVIIVLQILTLLGFLIVPLFVHLGMRIMKGTGSLQKTYQAVIFGSTPYLLLGTIPLIGYAALIYGLYIKIVGLSEFHRLRFDYTIVGYVIGRVIGYVVAIILTIIIMVIIVIGIAGMIDTNPTLQAWREKLNHFEQTSIGNTQATTTINTSPSSSNIGTHSGVELNAEAFTIIGPTTLDIGQKGKWILNSNYSRPLLYGLLVSTSSEPYPLKELRLATFTSSPEFAFFFPRAGKNYLHFIVKDLADDTIISKIFEVTVESKQ
ncbi:MAG: Yip1 domain [Candidatus Paceibacter sp.]|nr:Yip1 domain [Candidatus Paceibacter sp.]